jgi:regulator of ribosome biosynthesis
MRPNLRKPSDTKVTVFPRSYATMSAVISGAELLAAAGAAGGAAALALKHDDLTYDLGLLAAFDSHPVDPAAFAEDAEAALEELATENTQLLIKRIFELPVEKTDLGPVVSVWFCGAGG